MSDNEHNENPILKIINSMVKAHYSSVSELETILEKEKKLFKEIISEHKPHLTEQVIDEIRIRFNGKKSPLAELLKSIKNIPVEDKKNAGAKINSFKEILEKEMQKFISEWSTHKENAKLASEEIDITLPVPPLNIGYRHPISMMMNEFISPLKKMGFTLIDGPELESEFYNFEALNVKKDHPAREMQDTFFLSSNWVLRTQTSNMQAHALLERELPLKIICPGFVYRNECDISHVPAFRQLECLVVDKNIHFGHLRYTMNTFFNEVFGRPVRMRLRSSYFPFTEPSAEMDVECQQCFGKGCRSCKFTGWVEIGGCGVVNKEVFKHCGIDPEVYSGFAFGFGVDRMAMLKYGIADLRSMFEGNINLSQSLML